MYEGKLIRLRAFEADDVQSNFQFVNDYETVRGMISGIPFPSSMADEQDWINRQTNVTRGEYQFAIEKINGELIGRCGITSVDWKNRNCDLAIMIGSEHRRKGFGTEAMALLCRFCFHEMNLYKLKVRVFEFNLAAIRCYEKNGFVTEGILRDEIWRDGEYQNVRLMAKIKEQQ